MSIALLGQVYDDMRRIAVAGSAVAPGDFRLKKHIAPLEQAGAKVPIFATVATHVKAVVDSSEKTASQAMLELASLLNAILYTQGETSTPGPMEEIETTELELSGAAQISARTLKPLLEALSNTGSGRMEMIKDAYERGAFKDVRLVKPSLAALDDGYGEIADFIAKQVLPLYGRAILPELRAKLDIKGKAGHALRLALLHKLDSATARPFVEKALESGSKEMKVAAIECLGSGPDDLTFLVEQSAAKAQDVRRAAYLALATIDNPKAVDVLTKAMAGKDVELVAPALIKSEIAAVRSQVIAAVESQVEAVKAAEDKKVISATINRIQILLHSLWNKCDARLEKLLLKLFAERLALAKVRGETVSGSDLNRAVNSAMMNGNQTTQDTLAASHATLSADELGNAFLAARKAWPPERVLKEFRPLLKADGKAKKDTSRCDAIIDALHSLPAKHDWLGNWIMPEDTDNLPRLHPDWLDAAVEAGQLDAVTVLGRPGHAGQNRFLKQAFDVELNKKGAGDCTQVVASMVRLQHPDATDCLIAAVAKADKKTHWQSYHYEWLIFDLPASAIPKLEAIVPTLPERDADRWMDRIAQLRVKHRTPHG